MKNLLLSSLLTLAALGASSQKLIIKTYVEKTQMSPKSGSSISYENSYGWEFGAFFQESSLMESMLMTDEQRAALPRIYEKEFYGAFFSVPVRGSDLIDVKMQVRTGVANGTNFLITPSILADYKPFKGFKLGLGIGARMFKPTTQVSVSFSL